MFQAEAAGAYSNSKVILPGGGKVNEPVWAGQFSAQVNIGPLSLAGHYQHIEGLARLANGDFPDTFLVGSDLQTLRTNGYYAGASYRLTPELSFNGVYGWHEADPLPGVAAWRDTTVVIGDKAVRRHQSIHANALYKFWGRMQAGIEYRRYWVDTFNNPKREGDVNIVHGALWFFF
jgi:predicted porin